MLLLVCLFICSAASFPVEGELCYVLSYDNFYSIFPEGKVSIIVKNEVNVDCSENFSVMLICEGVNLAELRWSYRSSKDLHLVCRSLLIILYNILLTLL